MSEEFHGLLLMNKDPNWTSHQLVEKIRSLFNQKSIGHAGTLDPMAQGLLVVLCGMATKLSSYFINHDKRYKLSFQLGLETDTFDLSGKLIGSQTVSLKREDIVKQLKKWTGEMEIPVPIFSAVKQKGRKLYSYAFSGRDKDVRVPLKRMSFWDLDIHDIQKDKVCLSLSCSKGSYIRSWVHYFGKEIQTGACLTALERLSSGPFSLKSSLSIQELEKKLSKKRIKQNGELKALLGDSFLYPKSALRGFQEIFFTRKWAKCLQKGRVPYYLKEEYQAVQIEVNKKGCPQTLKVVCGEKLVALLEMRPYEKIKILRNFPNQIF